MHCRATFCLIGMHAADWHQIRQWPSNYSISQKVFVWIDFHQYVFLEEAWESGKIGRKTWEQPAEQQCRRLSPQPSHRIVLVVVSLWILLWISSGQIMSKWSSGFFVIQKG